MVLDDYIKARKSGKHCVSKAKSERKSIYLPVLSEMETEYKNLKEESLGCFEVPLSLVCGTLTKGRQECFAPNYMPLLSPYSEFAIKWQNLLESQMEEGIRDEIDVYEYFGRFYVVEGNKRVSVMKYLEQPKILANVLRLIPKEADSPKYAIYKEFLSFYKETSFYGIYFNHTGGFERLAELFKENLHGKWSEDELINIKSAYNTFDRLARKKYELSSVEIISDLFLEYCEREGADSLLNDTDDCIKKKMDKLKSKTAQDVKVQSSVILQIDSSANKIATKIYNKISDSISGGEKQ